MSVLIINGSPRKDGNTMFFINQIKNKISCDVVSPYYMDFTPCTDCRRCIKGECVYNDEVTELFKKIDDYDVIIAATPLYFNQPTGVLMSMLSRTQEFFNNKRLHKEKVGYIILTGGGDTVINSADAEKTLRIMLRGLNVSVKDYVRSLHTSKIPACEDIEAIEKLNNIIKKIND